MNAKRAMTGVTLLELMVVVVILGVLTAIAYPSYTAFVDRAKRNEAKGALLQVATNQEKLYLQSNTFTTDLTALGLSTSPVFRTDSGAYDVTISEFSNLSNSFTATATYLLAGQEKNKCLTYTIDASGSRTSGPDTDCWTRTR